MDERLAPSASLVPPPSQILPPPAGVEGQDSAVLPTLTHRIEVLDVLRGAAILAILLANLVPFMTPLFQAMEPGFNRTLLEVDQWLAAARESLVNGKARSLLCILFGVGLWLQFQKREKAPGQWPKSYHRRMGFLLLIGLCHALFIWSGDILVTYAFIALAATAFVKVKDGMLAIMCGMGLAVGLGLGLVFTLIMNLLPNAMDKAWESLPFGSFFNPANEVLIFQEGGYFLQFLHRVLSLQVMAGNVLVLTPLLGSLFLIGFLLARRGFLRESTRQPGDMTWVLGIGLGLGIPLNALPLIAKAARVEVDLMYLIEMAGGPFLALGLFGLGVAIVPRLPRLILEPLARAGKVALSIYLMQSILATWVFYSWGLGLYSKLTFGQSLWVAAGIWGANLTFAWFWTQRYTMGPVEWAWRSLDVGRPLPLRKEADPA